MQQIHRRDLEADTEETDDAFACDDDGQETDAGDTEDELVTAAYLTRDNLTM